MLCDGTLVVYPGSNEDYFEYGMTHKKKKLFSGN